MFLSVPLCTYTSKSLQLLNVPSFPSSFTCVLLHMFPPGCLLSMQLGMIIFIFYGAGEDERL